MPDTWPTLLQSGGLVAEPAVKLQNLQLLFTSLKGREDALQAPQEDEKTHPVARSL